MTTHLLLTGAGFTYNWGGWLAKELEGDLLGRLASSPVLQRLVQDASNFEEALDTARRSLASDQVGALEATVKDSFQAMNAALAERFSLFLGGKELIVGPPRRQIFQRSNPTARQSPAWRRRWVDQMLRQRGRRYGGLVGTLPVFAEGRRLYGRLGLDHAQLMRSSNPHLIESCGRGARSR